MEKGFVENGFIIDLSNTKNTTQLVFELSSVMEHPEVKGKRICLKLGSLDLKQSQLLSIKALIESMDAEIAFVNSTSEQTEASAVSLGINVSKLSSDVEVGVYTATETDVEEEPVVVKEVVEEQEEGKTVEVDSGIEVEINEPITTVEGVEDTYSEQSTQELSEVIPAEHFGSDFEALAYSEGLLTNEEVSKYILLDTGDVLPEGAEENASDTKTLPTLYLNQTLRSGQTVNYEGNILIIGDAHPGSEIVADGDITVWGVLSGIAHAGYRGNINAKVRALKMNAVQLRIANCYSRRPDGTNIPYIIRSSIFTPEEARVVDGEIMLFKINQN